MKKFLALLLCMVMVIACVAGCKGNKGTVDTSSGSSSDDYIDASDDDTSSDEEPTDDNGDNTDNNESGSGGRHVVTTTSTYKRQTVIDNRSDAQKRVRSIEEGSDEDFLLRCIYRDTKGNYAGNMTRTANFIRKAKAGQATNVVVFGGVNCGAEDGYGSYLEENLQSAYGDKVNVYEYGMGSISSDKAVYLIKEHVIDYKPDLVVLDISVDDGSKAKALSVYYENVVRRILNDTSAGVIIVINAGCAEATWGKNNPDPIVTNEKYAKEVANYYQVPVIDFNNAVWDTIAELVEKKTYGELPLLTWSTFGDSFKKLGDPGNVNLGNAIFKYITEVEKKLNDASTKKAPALGDINNARTFKYLRNSYIKFSSIDIMKMRNGGTGGYKILSDEDHLVYPGGTDSWQFTDKNRTGTEVQYIRGKNPNDDKGASVGIEIQIPKVTASNPGHLIFATLASDATRISASYSPVKVTCYGADGKEIKNGTFKGTVSYSGGSYGAICMPITFAKDTVKIKIQVGTNTSGSGVALLGIARG